MLKGIVPIIRAGNGCDYHRLFLPLQEMGFDFELFNKGPGIKTFEGVELVIFNRIPLNPIEKLIEYKKKYGFKLVVDIDDYWILNTNHLIYPHWRDNKTGEKIVQCLEMADVVTCTTARLAEKVKPHNKQVYVLPNALPYDTDQFNADKVVGQDDKLRFIYAGGSTHFWDVKVLENPFKKLIHERIPGRFILAGYEGSNKAGIKVWDKIERAFNINGKLQNYERRNSLSIDSYMSHYSHADVAVVPLENNSFTPFKSNLKVLEAGCKKIPVIVSDLPPYNDDLNYLMPASNTAAWCDWIKYCISNPEFVKDMGEGLGQWVRTNYNLTTINIERKQIFEHLIKS